MTNFFARLSGLCLAAVGALLIATIAIALPPGPTHWKAAAIGALILALLFALAALESKE